MKKTFLILSILSAVTIANYSLLIINCNAQWVQQSLPSGGNTYDMVFFDASTGIISLDIPAVYRTTNGGTNWSLAGNYRVFRMEKIDSTTVYGNGRLTLAGERIYRTTDKGLTWDSVAINSNNFYGQISFLNRDTGWICGSDGTNSIIWKTTNGGAAITPQAINYGKDRLFFLKEKINGEYYGWSTNDVNMYKTTNSGITWNFIASQQGGNQMFFLNKDTGWIADGNMYRTNNGGVNWNIQSLPSGNLILDRAISRFCILNKNLIYGVGGNRFFGMGIIKGVIWKSTNGGQNWGFQQPDTSYPISLYTAIDFYDSLIGWAYTGGPGIYTTVGGGPLVSIQNHPVEIPKAFNLYQNYPNPFNPVTRIKYQITNNKSQNVRLTVYDILGKTVSVLVNQKQQAGTYEYTFDASALTSGVYYYKLETHNFTETKKMLLVK